MQKLGQSVDELSQAASARLMPATVAACNPAMLEPTSNRSWPGAVGFTLVYIAGLSGF